VPVRVADGSGMSVEVGDRETDAATSFDEVAVRVADYRRGVADPSNAIWRVSI
jgi:hypothetical protein